MIRFIFVLFSTFPGLVGHQASSRPHTIPGALAQLCYFGSIHSACRQLCPGALRVVIPAGAHRMLYAPEGSFTTHLGRAWLSTSVSNHEFIRVALFSSLDEPSLLAHCQPSSIKEGARPQLPSAHNPPSSAPFVCRTDANDR